MSQPASAGTIEAIATDGDYTYTFKPHPHRIRAVVDGVTVADSAAVMVLEETRLPPVFYFPPEDVRMDLMRPSARKTHCPFKGDASYWSLDLDGRVIENILWSYEDPLPESKAIVGYRAFYAELIDHWYEDDGELSADVDDAPPEFRNPLMAWLLREAPSIPDPVALTRSLCETMVASGIPLWRFHIIIRTLHPQVTAVAYRWWSQSGEVDTATLPYETLRLPQFMNSPLVPIFEGVGGIRRRLDVADPVLDFPVLEDLAAEGATDYVAMPMTFSDGQINSVTLSSARPGGFTTSELGHVYEILAVLGSLYEVHALRDRATTLLDTYLGAHAGARVLGGHIKRGDGETIQAVIWFCDLRESTPLAQSMGREAFLGLLNEFFDCMAGAVLEHGGQVLRFIGDAALSIFPMGPDESVCVAHDQALAAALEARSRMQALNAARLERGDRPIDYGIALHPGEVTYGNIGTANRLEFTVIGDAANRAARIESMCKTLGRSVLVSAGFAAHFPERFESLGPQELRGVEEPLELFALRDGEG